MYKKQKGNPGMRDRHLKSFLVVIFEMAVQCLLCAGSLLNNQKELM